MTETNTAHPEAQRSPTLTYEAVDSEYLLLMRAAAILTNVKRGEGFVKIVIHNGQPRTDESLTPELVDVEIDGTWRTNGGILEDYSNSLKAIEHIHKDFPLTEESLPFIPEIFRVPTSADTYSPN